MIKPGFGPGKNRNFQIKPVESVFKMALCFVFHSGMYYTGPVRNFPNQIQRARLLNFSFAGGGNFKSKYTDFV